MKNFSLLSKKCSLEIFSHLELKIVTWFKDCNNVGIVKINPLLKVEFKFFYL